MPSLIPTRSRPRWFIALAFAVLLCGGLIPQTRTAVASPEDPATVHADSHVDGAASHDDHGGGHSDPFSFVLIELAVVVILAIIGRWLAGRFNQAAVLGELMIGVIVGNIGYWLGKPLFVLIMHISDADQIIHAVWSSGASVHDAARQAFPEATMGPESIVGQLVNIMTGPAGGNYILMSSALWMFSSLGVILLLFMVGLESSVGEMLKVGGRATAVAIVGIIAPFGLGYVTCLWLLPDAGTPAHLFMSATLCATSVGITARVFKDLGTMQRPEAKVILGAAVIDDILGLIILAIVVGVVKSGEVKGDEIMKISLMSAVFLGAVILVGERFARGAARVMGVLDRDNNKLLFPLALACFLSWAANQIELATIVGAFAAGLILNEKHFEEHAKSTTVEELIAPLERIFAPVFFVLMGMQVNLASFVDPGTIKLAAIFSVVAIIGKVVCGLPAGKDMDRLSIGIGMVPRGEVGLIFASIGRSMGVVNDEVFSAIVVVVMVSTLITPPAMKWSMQRTA